MLPLRWNCIAEKICCYILNEENQIMVNGSAVEDLFGCDEGGIAWPTMMEY